MNKRYISLILLSFSLAALAGSISIAVRNPPFAGPGLMPAVVSAVMVLCTAGELIFPVKGGEERVPFPVRNLLIALGFIALLCLALWLGLDFYIAAGIFLMGFMCCLSKGKFLRNLIVTAVSLVLIYLVFTLGLEIDFR